MSRGRRRYQPDWPASLGTQRRRLGRTMLVLGIAILLSVVATARLRTPDAPGREPPTVTPATATAAAARSGPAPAAASTTPAITPAGGVPPALEHRADGWYAPGPIGTLVQVERIVDGDTLIARAGGESFRVRVFGIAAPETGQRCASEATARLRTLAGAEVRLLPDRRQRDAFGRELRYLFTTNQQPIDAALVAEGSVSAWKDDGAYRDLLRSMEAEAREAKRGCLWSGN